MSDLPEGLRRSPFSLRNLPGFQEVRIEAPEAQGEEASEIRTEPKRKATPRKVCACPGCSNPVPDDARNDAETCSNACRQKLYRRRKDGSDYVITAEDRKIIRKIEREGRKELDRILPPRLTPEEVRAYIRETAELTEQADADAGAAAPLGPLKWGPSPDEQPQVKGRSR